jgi:hypothetical protein
LKHLTEDCLVLQPKKGALFWHALIVLGLSFGLLAGVVYAVVVAIQGDEVWGVILFCSIGLLVMAAFLFLGLSGASGFKRWIFFDRREGVLTISRRPFGFRRSPQVIRTWPLRDLVCIQLLYSGFHSIEVGEPGTPGSVVYYHTYQMNLVFDDGKETRYNLASHSDWKWMREVAQELADFVGVPIADQLQHGPR